MPELKFHSLKRKKKNPKNFASASGKFSYRSVTFWEFLNFFGLFLITD